MWFDFLHEEDNVRGCSYRCYDLRKAHAAPQSQLRLLLPFAPISLLAEAQKRIVSGPNRASTSTLPSGPTPTDPGGAGSHGPQKPPFTSICAHAAAWLALCC